MLHTMYFRNRSAGSREGFTICGRGGHLDHMTSIMLINFHFLVLKSFHTKFSEKWLSGFLEKQV